MELLSFRGCFFGPRMNADEREWDGSNWMHIGAESVILPVEALIPMEIQFTTRIFKEGRTYVAHALELDVSSCGGSNEKALKNLKEAVRLFLDEAEKMGTLDQILEESGYGKPKQKVARPKFVSVQRVTLQLPLTQAKA